MPLLSTHTTPPDASFTGTGSAAWAAPHGFGGVVQNNLVGRFSSGTGAPEDIVLGTNLVMGGTGALDLGTTGVTAGTYGGTLGPARFDISPTGRVISATSEPQLGVNTYTAAAVTLSTGDNGRILHFANGVAGTLTVATNLGNGFNCLLARMGTGALTVAAGTGVSLLSRGTLVTLNGRYAAASLMAVGTNTFVLAGDLA